MNLYIAKCKRKNIDQKPDYDHIFKYSNGWPILFNTENEALQYATERCSLPEFSMYGPACELANVSRYRSLKGAACMGVTENE